ncbi:MAG: cation:proton antiporter [Gammaproteobacteria bacterium]|jgi:CPA2 family monovalent cation:H+ antiporter-2
MHIDPLLPTLVAIIAVVLLIGLSLQLLRQPQVIGYLLAGVAIGPFGLALLTDVQLASRLGGFGVVLLLFFVGMEVAPRQLLSGWRIAVVGTLVQVALSVVLVIPIGLWFSWPIERIILLGFVTSLSSTAVIIKLLRDSGEINQKEGQDILGILLVQDLVVIPMLIIIGLLGGETPGWSELGLQIGGSIAIISVLLWALSRDSFHFPYGHLLRSDPELQVFAALLICLGLSLLTGMAHLSTALGAFAAGILVTAARETQWVHHSLEPFRVIFVALFFVSVGLLVDVSFIIAHAVQVLLLVVIVLVGNTLLNGIILRLLGYRWRESFYAGALLAQIGEFSFVLAAVGLTAGIITEIAYQYTIAVIALSLLVSPFWILAARRILRVSCLEITPGPGSPSAASPAVSVAHTTGHDNGP